MDDLRQIAERIEAALRIRVGGDQTPDDQVIQARYEELKGMGHSFTDASRLARTEFVYRLLRERE